MPVFSTVPVFGINARGAYGDLLFCALRLLKTASIRRPFGVDPIAAAAGAEDWKFLVNRRRRRSRSEFGGR